MDREQLPRQIELLFVGAEEPFALGQRAIEHAGKDRLERLRRSTS